MKQPSIMIFEWSELGVFFVLVQFFFFFYVHLLYFSTFLSVAGYILSFS